MAREANAAWQLFVMPSDGGNIQHLSTGPRNAAGPSWSSDGTQTVFGRLNDVMGNDVGPRFLEILDTRTGISKPIPGSAGMFNPGGRPTAG